MTGCAPNRPGARSAGYAGDDRRHRFRPVGHLVKWADCAKPTGTRVECRREIRARRAEYYLEQGWAAGGTALVKVKSALRCHEV